MTRIALIGLGEVGAVLAADLGRLDGLHLRAWDLAFADPSSRASANAATQGLERSPNAAAAVQDAELVISAVTAANDLSAAAAVAAALSGPSWFLDLNSAAPTHKQAAAAAIERAGGRYVEAAVMSPIEPLRLGAPILLGGPHAEAFAGYGAGLGFTGLRPYAGTVGPAAATKLCRSVVVKGLEALVTESLLAARAWNVEADVLGSLSNLLPADDWDALAGYLISRSLQHGTRRAEEMREAAAMVAAAGVDPVCSQAVARRQEWTGAASAVPADADLATILEAVAADGSPGVREPGAA